MGSGNGFDSHVTRRAFLGWAGKGALVLGCGGVLRTWPPSREFSRPPGAVPEDKFLSLCVRCHRCAEVCPFGSIRPVRITESLLDAGTPVMQGLCWRGHCQVNCIANCPTGALQ